MKDFLFMVINFVILFGALWLVAGKRVIASFRSRREDIAGQLEEAGAAQARAEQSGQHLQELTLSHNYMMDDSANAALQERQKNTEISRKETAEAVRTIQEDTEASGHEMLTEMYRQVCSDSVRKIAGRAQEIISSDAYAEGRKGMADDYAKQIGTLIRPAVNDLYKLRSGRPLDIEVASSEEVDYSVVRSIRDAAADSYLDYCFDVDEDLGGVIEVEIGGRKYRGTLEDVVAEISGLNTANA